MLIKWKYYIFNPSIWYTATGGFTSTMKMVEEIDSAIK